MTNKKFFVVLIMVFLIICCSSCKRQHVYVDTETIDDSLYMETYQIYFGGVFDGDAYAIYLTDSTNFRAYLGDYNDHLWPRIIVQDDAVKIKWQDVKLMHRKFRYNLKSLKTKGSDDLTHSKYHPNQR